MKKIYFVRHGESEANRQNIAAGGEFDTPLTDIGREQAVSAGKKLKDLGIELIVASEQSRAQETARIIADEIGYEKTKIKSTPLFVERGFGIYSGRPDPEYLSAVEKNVDAHKSVEPAAVLEARILQGLEWLKQQKAEKILIVGHSGVSRMLRLINHNLPHSHMYKIDRLPNGEIYEFDLK